MKKNSNSVSKLLLLLPNMLLWSLGISVIIVFSMELKPGTWKYSHLVAYILEKTVKTAKNFKFGKTFISSNFS